MVLRLRILHQSVLVVGLLFSGRTVGIFFFKVFLEIAFLLLQQLLRLLVHDWGKIHDRLFFLENSFFPFNLFLLFAIFKFLLVFQKCAQVSFLFSSLLLREYLRSKSTTFKLLFFLLLLHHLYLLFLLLSLFLDLFGYLFYIYSLAFNLI